MPEALGQPPSPRAALFWNGAAWQWALVDAAGHIQVDVLSTAMDALAATAANQATMIAALQLIDDLRNALDSVGTDELDVNVEASVLPTGAATEATLATLATEATLVAFAGAAATEARLVITNTLLTQIATLRTALQSLSGDRLIVRGEDQLHSYAGIMLTARSAAISAADGYVDSNPGLANRVWVITNVAVRDQDTAITRLRFIIRRGAVNYIFHEEVIALDPANWASIQCLKWLQEDDVVRVYFLGALATDTCHVHLTGHYMTLET